MTAPPDWFVRAIAAPHTRHSVPVSGCDVSYLRWGDGGKPAVILLHGGGAHALWWGFLAPLLAVDYDVIAVDLSGHGDSGHRDRYPREVWAEDIKGVIADADLSRPFLVGHSMGGFVSIVSAALFGEHLAGAIVVDSPVPPRSTDSVAGTPEPSVDEPKEGESSRWSFQRMKPHADLATAVGRFRLLPPQPSPYPYLIEYVAQRSVRETPGGFVWKFDPRVFEKTSRSSLVDYLAAARCRLALVRGAESAVLTRETAAFMRTVAPPPFPYVEVPEAYHHLMFDQPLALVVAIRALLAGWSSG